MGPRRSGHSLYKQPGVNHISAMAQSEGGHHSSKNTDKVKKNDQVVVKKQLKGSKYENQGLSFAKVRLN